MTTHGSELNVTLTLLFKQNETSMPLRIYSFSTSGGINARREATGCRFLSV